MYSYFLVEQERSRPPSLSLSLSLSPKTHSLTFSDEIRISFNFFEPLWQSSFPFFSLSSHPLFASFLVNPKVSRLSHYQCFANISIKLNQRKRLRPVTINFDSSFFSFSSHRNNMVDLFVVFPKTVQPRNLYSLRRCKITSGSLFRVMEGSKIFTCRFTRIRNSFVERNAEFVFFGGSVFYINRREEKYLIRTSNSVRAAFMHAALLDHSHSVMRKIAVPRRKGEKEGSRDSYQLPRSTKSMTILFSTYFIHSVSFPLSSSDDTSHVRAPPYFTYSQFKHLVLQ